MEFFLTDDERMMIINALQAYESEFNCGTPADKVYFTKVLALADRIGSRPDGWNSLTDEDREAMAVEMADKVSRRK